MLLGVFCLNVSGGLTMSAAKDNTLHWGQNVRVAQAADRTGWDFLLPLGRWRGLGGATNPCGEQFETFTWAAGIGAVTERIKVYSTCHVPLFHPIMAAKQAATADLISDGRFGLNIVAGWNLAEFGMFGVDQHEHDDRYRAAHEWLTVIEQLWSEDEVEFSGRFYNVRNGYLAPKPASRPRPTIVAAGSSEAGLDFSLRRADYSFVSAPNWEVVATQAAKVKAHAHNLGLPAKMLTFGPVVVRDTEAEARRYYDWYVDEHGDFGAARNLIESLFAGGGQGLPDEVKRSMDRAFVGGWGGTPMIGTPEQITDMFLRLRDHGYVGYAAGWLDFEEGIGEFNEKVMPLLEQAGLRAPIATTAGEPAA